MLFLLSLLEIDRLLWGSYTEGGKSVLALVAVAPLCGAGKARFQSAGLPSKTGQVPGAAAAYQGGPERDAG